jgi:organic hydroperoxide reductase OsmC/OhrA
MVPLRPGFSDGKILARAHLDVRRRCDGAGIAIAAVVPAAWSNAASVDPEEAFVASIASCHMLTFLWLASREGFQADSYEDNSVGVMTKNERGVPWVNAVTLRPRIAWSGEKLPAPADVERLHHLAHEECFIANSVKTAITVEPAV